MKRNDCKGLKGKSTLWDFNIDKKIEQEIVTTKTKQEKLGYIGKPTYSIQDATEMLIRSKQRKMKDAS